VNSPTNDNPYAEYTKLAPVLPPLGILSLASMLRENGEEVLFLDCQATNKNIADVITKIKKDNPDIIGITSSTVTINKTKELIRRCKKENKNMITILGGSHISALPEEVMKECPELDIGCIGEGEMTIKEIVSAIKNDKPLDDIKGIIYRKNKEITRTPRRGLVKDLDSLPKPAFDLIKDSKQYIHSLTMRSSGATFPLISSRGCYYNCKFCDQNVFSGRWRGNSPERVLEMMKDVQKLFNVDFISFEDDNFALNKGRVIRICKLIINNRLNIKWGCSLYPRNVDEKMLKWMKKAGCWTIYIGIESGSQRMIDYMNKKNTLKEIKDCVKLIKKHNINVYGSFILGLPTETKENIEQTIAFAKEIPLDGVSFFTYAPYPGTEFYKELIKEKRINKEWDNYSGHNTKPISVNNNISTEYLLKKQKEAYRKFYLRPKYIATHLKRIVDPYFVKSALRFLAV